MIREDKEILLDAIDIHVHSAPSLLTRHPVEDIVRSAQENGMRALILKNHHINTTDRAYFMNKIVENVDVFGSVVLNYANGGINAFAADAAIRMGAKAVWLPTIDTAQQKEVYGDLGGYGSIQSADGPSFYDKMEGIRILKGDSLIPEMLDVLEVCHEANVFLGVGHVSFEEADALVDEAYRIGFSKLVIDHPNFPFFNITHKEQKKWAEKGAWINHVFCELSPKWNLVNISTVTEDIRAVGVEHCIISSDLGQLHNPLPAEGLRIYAQMLLEEGMSVDEIRTMMVKNPARILYDE